MSARGAWPEVPEHALTVDEHVAIAQAALAPHPDVGLDNWYCAIAHALTANVMLRSRADSAPTSPISRLDCALCNDPKIASNHRAHEPSYNNPIYREWAALNYGDDFQRRQRYGSAST